MGDAVERLTKKVGSNHVALTRIFIPPYIRVREGQVEHVDSYWREIDGLGDLKPEELDAVMHNADAEMWSPARHPMPAVGRAGGLLPTTEPQFRDLAEAREMPKFEVGDRVIVAHELGTEEGTVSSFGPNDPLVTVTFDDGTNSAWLRTKVSKKPRLQVTDEGIFDVTGQPDLDPPDLPGGNLPTERADPGTIGAVLEAKAGVQRPPAEPLTPSGHRPLNRIAAEIYDDWKQPNFAAKPYLEALRDLRDIQDTYGYDSASSVVAYFLSNASSWRGPKAKEIKAELNAILKKS